MLCGVSARCAGADQRSFCVDLVEVAKQEVSEALRLFELPEDRLDYGLAPHVDSPPRAAPVRPAVRRRAGCARSAYPRPCPSVGPQPEAASPPRPGVVLRATCARTVDSHPPELHSVKLQRQL